MKYIYTLLLMFAVTLTASAQASIKFDKNTLDLGVFSEADGVQSGTYTFTNVGNQPLVLNNVVASCGCTTTSYTKTPIRPGEKGEIKIKYNGAGKFPGHFKKSVTVRTNGVPEVTRLYLEGEMTEDKKEAK